MPKIIFSLALVLAAIGVSAHAGVKAFKGESGETMLIETGNEPNVAYVKVHGLASEWNDKILKTRLATDHSGGEEYVIDYERKHGLQKGKKQFHMVDIPASSQTLAHGTIVRVARVYMPGLNKDGVYLKWDEKLTNVSQSEALAAAYKKSPFVPKLGN